MQGARTRSLDQLQGPLRLRLKAPQRLDQGLLRAYGSKLGKAVVNVRQDCTGEARQARRVVLELHQQRRGLPASIRSRPRTGGRPCCGRLFVRQALAAPRRMPQRITLHEVLRCSQEAVRVSRLGDCQRPRQIKEPVADVVHFKVVGGLHGRAGSRWQVLR